MMAKELPIAIKIRYLLIFLLATVLLSCGDTANKKVVYLHPSLSRARFVKDGSFMMERLKQLGYDASMVDADDNESLQIEKGIKLIDEGVDVLIVTPVNGNTIAPMIRYAKDKGVVVIAYNRLINNTDYDVFFTGDNINNGEILCNTTLSLCPTGNYVVLGGDRFDRNGVELKQSIDSILAPHVAQGNVNIIYETFVEAYGAESTAYEFEQIVQTWGSNIDAVITCHDRMATSVIDILKRNGMAGKVITTGQDATKEGVTNIKNGYQHVTIYHPHKKLGYAVADLAKSLIEGTKAREFTTYKTFNGYAQIPTVKVRSVTITKDNYAKELIETGEYKSSDLQ
ncbi:MAG: substrate-binding domain-containing protein [Breznakibacter sp.]